MTVTELIKELEKVENKELEVKYVTPIQVVALNQVDIEHLSFGGHIENFVNIH